MDCGKSAGDEFDGDMTHQVPCLPHSTHSRRTKCCTGHAKRNNKSYRGNLGGGKLDEGKLHML